MSTLRTEFKNASDGVQGAVVMDDTGKPKGVAVRPGDSIWLTETEEILTANAPRRDEDNPFANGSFTLLTRATEVSNRRPIGSREAGEAPTSVEESPDDGKEMSQDWDTGNEPQALPRVERQATEEVGAPPLPEGDPALGARTPGEEVGQPEVVASGRRGRGKTVRTDNPAAGPPVKEGVQHAVVVGQGGMQYKEAADG
jgi:hypothetical protein